MLELRMIRVKEGCVGERIRLEEKEKSAETIQMKTRVLKRDVRSESKGKMRMLELLRLRANLRNAPGEKENRNRRRNETQ